MSINMRIFWVLACLLLGLSACEEDPCNGKNCENGVCDTVSGDCLCSRGYQIDSSGICTVPWSNNFLGTYNVEDSCVGQPAVFYTTTITAAGADKIGIANFGNLGRTITVDHVTSMTLEIDHSVPDTTITGTGEVLNNVLIFEYFVNDLVNQKIDTCIAFYR